MNANQTKFNAALAVAYSDLFAKPEYAYAAACNTAQELADKMTASFIAGTANKDGEGVKRACKACGIKYTYTGIDTFLGGL